MRNLIGTRAKAICVVGLFVLLLVFLDAWDPTAQIRGRLAARCDVARGRFIELTYGLPPAWLPEYARLLRERYGIEMRPVAGCVVSENLVSYVNGYDEVNYAAAERKFGRDVFRECADKAQQDWERRNAMKKAGE